MSGAPVTVLVQSVTPAVVTVAARPPPVLTVVAGVQGPSGPPGPEGEGGMQSLIYDPAGVRDNCFNLANLTGHFDAGTF